MKAQAPSQLRHDRLTERRCRQPLYQPLCLPPLRLSDSRSKKSKPRHDKSNGRGMHLQVDVWSLGVVLYAGLVGRPPFEAADVKATYKRIKANDYCFPDAVPLSDDAKHLVRWALSPAPEHRPTLSQILSHPFVVTNRTRPMREKCGAVGRMEPWGCICMHVSTGMRGCRSLPAPPHETLEATL
jgi:serine/threonine protein kinase